MNPRRINYYIVQKSRGVTSASRIYIFVCVKYRTVPCQLLLKPQIIKPHHFFVSKVFQLYCVFSKSRSRFADRVQRRCQSPHIHSSLCQLPAARKELCQLQATRKGQAPAHGRTKSFFQRCSEVLTTYASLFQCFLKSFFGSKPVLYVLDFKDTDKDNSKSQTWHLILKCYFWKKTMKFQNSVSQNKIVSIQSLKLDVSLAHYPTQFASVNLLSVLF